MSELDKCRQIIDTESGRVLLYRDEVEAVLTAGDTISRRHAVEAVKNYWKAEVDAIPKDTDFCTVTDTCDMILKHNAELCRVLDQLPSAQSEQRWTPCSERPPEEIGTYMTTIDYGRAGLAVGQRFYCGKYLGWEDECVIAWMPLPEPYREGEQDE